MTTTTTMADTNLDIPQNLVDGAKGRDEQRKREPATFEYSFHSLADCLPLLEGKEFDALVADITAHGLRVPITTHEGQVLDGRNRYRACNQVTGFKFKPEDFVTLPISVSPVEFIISANVRRRHLNESQRAMAAAKLVSTKLGYNQHTRKLGRSIDLPTAANLLNVSEPSVKRAKV
jgi:hypothetical protein